MPVARKKPAGKPAGRGEVVVAAGLRGPPLDAASVPDRPKATGFPRHKPYGLGPEERLGAAGDDRMVPGLGRGPLGASRSPSWRPGSPGRPNRRRGSCGGCGAWPSVITAALPANHPPRLKPPPVRLRDLSAPP